MAYEGFSRLEVMIQLKEPLAGSEIVKMIKDVCGDFPATKDVTFEILSLQKPVKKDGDQHQYFTIEIKTRSYSALPKEAVEFYARMVCRLNDRFLFF